MRLIFLFTTKFKVSLDKSKFPTAVIKLPFPIIPIAPKPKFPIPGIINLSFPIIPVAVAPKLRFTK